MEKIKVLVVEDSILFRNMLVKYINEDPEMEVVGVAEDPFEARDQIIACKPDVMTLDIELPKMNGIDFLRKLMPQYPIRTIVISTLSEKVFDALQAGAVDFVAKPVVSDRRMLEEFVKKELPGQIKVAAKAKLGKKTMPSGAANPDVKESQEKLPTLEKGDRQTIIAIGASTGGTEATANMLKLFGGDLPGILITQHMPPVFTQMYAERLDQRTGLHFRVKEAKDGDIVQPGLALLAPGGDLHMELEKKHGQYMVSIKRSGKVNGHCPSVDVLFESVAKAAGPNAVGIILTGMGGDGAKGLLAMRKAGARTIGQDESTCVVYGMPKVAYEIGAVEYQEKLLDIPKRMYKVLKEMKK